MDPIHIFIAISAILKIQIITLEVKTGSSCHIWGSFRRKKIKVAASKDEKIYNKKKNKRCPRILLTDCFHLRGVR